MILSNIHSKYLIQELFSFIKENKKLKIIKYNLFLLNKLDLSINDYKISFYQTIIENYDCLSIKNYYQEFKKDFNSINDEELKELLLNCLSKNQNFNLRLLDEYFNLMINNLYFKKNIRINIDDLIEENIPKILLIKDNKLTNKAIKTFKDIFNLFSIDNKMNKNQYAKLVSLTIKKEVNENDERINYLFSNYNINNDGLLLFEEFLKFYFDSIKDKINVVWDNLYSLGYNNLLEKDKEIDYNYILNNLEEFEKNDLFSNLLKISNEKIYKITLLMNTKKEFIKFLNNKQIFLNIKKIDISISNLNKLIELKIICPNIEELNLKIIDEDYNSNELNNIFPNINILNICILEKFNLFNLLRDIKDSNIYILNIYIFNNDDINYEFESQIILKNIINLEININVEYKNNFIFEFFNNIELPYLKQYILNFNSNQFIIQKLKLNNSDFNIINHFLIDTLNNTNQFNLNTFFNLSNQLKLIRYLELNLKYFHYIYEKRRGIKYLFKFNLKNEDEFKKYYSNIDLSINKEEIIKYKKIDIKGIKFNNNIEEIIEKDNINLCDIYLNLNLNQYFIKSFKNLRYIYSENEIKLNDLLLINNENLNNLKYINITLGELDDKIYSILSQIIQHSQNLKSLILRLHPHNFNQNINFFIQLIQNLKKLRIINISQNIINPKYDLYLDKILNEFPKLKERKYYFTELK